MHIHDLKHIGYGFPISLLSIKIKTDNKARKSTVKNEQAYMLNKKQHNQ